MASNDSVDELLSRLGERASITMQELRCMDRGDLKQVTRHDSGQFDNERWLVRELQELGRRFDDVEEEREESRYQ